MPRWAQYAAWLAAGWLIAWVTFRLGLPLGWSLVVFALLWLLATYVAPRLYVAFVYPSKAHAAMLALVDPYLKPPAGVPATIPLLERMDAAADAKDWRALRAMLAPDFAFVDASGKRHGTKLYCCTLQNMQRMYPVLDQDTNEVLADPYDPNVLYVNTRTLGRPRRGPAFDVTAWSRWELAPGHEQVREMAHFGVIRVD